MMIKRKLLVLTFLVILLYFFPRNRQIVFPVSSASALENLLKNSNNLDGGVVKGESGFLTIASLKDRVYKGSDITIEDMLDPGPSYQRYIVSYSSDGLKIYGLLTVPFGQKPQNGWPVIIFNHGYIPPNEYHTADRYYSYVDSFARNGYIVFKPDYRGHGRSEGKALGGYSSNDYTIDVLNALASIKKFPSADSSKIGMAGHSMGGFITLRSMIVDKEIKAGVIWSGVVGSYDDLLHNWNTKNTTSNALPKGVLPWRSYLVEKYGSPEKNKAFWDSISSNTYLSNISGPLQLHHATADDQVPVAFSQNLTLELLNLSKAVEFYQYDNDDHNLSNNFDLAMERSLSFVDTFVKNAQ